VWAQGTKVARNFTAYDYDALRQNILSHASRHAAGGPDEITPELIGAETPSGAQMKVNALAGAGNTKTVKEIDDELTAHLAEDVTEPQGVHGLRVQNGQIEYWDKDDEEWKRIAGG